MNFIGKVEKAKDLIKESINKYERIALACSFGKDSMTVLHLALQVKDDIPIFTIITPFKPLETLYYRLNIQTEWGLYVHTYQAQDIGKIDDPDACCQYYKVMPTRRAIEELKLDAWITGLRRTEGYTRENYDYVEIKNGLVKVNPILDFTELDVWRYLALNQIRVNPLYKLGYRSLGCELCSKKEEDETETERAGRWAGTSKCGGECGIHTQALR